MKDGAVQVKSFGFAVRIVNLDKFLTADYVLEYRNTKLATVEAKAWDLALTEGVGQAKDYATKLAIRYTYATNGQGIYAIDMETGHEGEVSQYPTPDELWNKTFAKQNVWRDRFADPGKPEEIGRVFAGVQKYLYQGGA